MSEYASFETVDFFFERLFPAFLRLLMLPTSEFFAPFPEFVPDFAVFRGAAFFPAMIAPHCILSCLAASFRSARIASRICKECAASPARRIAEG